MNLICVHIKHISSAIMNSLSRIDKAISHTAIWGASISSLLALLSSISILPCISLFLIIDYVFCLAIVGLLSAWNRVRYVHIAEWMSPHASIVQTKMFDRWWAHDTKFMLLARGVAFGSDVGEGLLFEFRGGVRILDILKF